MSQDLVTTASLVLVVEKDAVFQRLLEEGVLTCGLLPPLVTFHHSCIQYQYYVY